VVACWSAETRALARPRVVLPWEIDSAALSPGGEFLVVAGESGNVGVWALLPPP
jgi:hypothetical protein